MNLRLNKLKKKFFASLVPLAIFVFSLFIPSFRTTLFPLLKEPLKLFTLVQREIGALIYFHRNFIQYEKSKKEIALLRYKINSQQELVLENKRLKELLAFREKNPYKLIATRVIARSADNWSSTVVIDKGSQDGIERGMSALTYVGLAGRVIETAKNTSKIMLINDPSMSVSALAQRSRQEGLISGTLGRNLIMKYLGEEPDIKLKDVIITSGLSQAYPKGLLIGQVVEIRKDFSGISFYAIVNPAVNLSKIEELLIILQ